VGALKTFPIETGRKEERASKVEGEGARD